MTVGTGGPYVAVAIFCEKILQEKDGVFSYIRVVDRVVVTSSGPDAMDKMPPVSVNLVAVIQFKPDTALGRHKLTLRPEDPSGLKGPEMSSSLNFEGGDRGAGMTANVSFQAMLEGLYWFDVLLDDLLITRMPLRVIYNPITVKAQG